MLERLVRALTQRSDDEQPIEALGVEAIRDRIGEPLPPRPPAPDYVRRDARAHDTERSWRRIAGLTR